jgi:hypothetical protein
MAQGSREENHTTAIYAAHQGNEVERRQAVEHIIATHWKPLYKYLRFRQNLSADEAQMLLAKYLEEFLKPAFFGRFDSHAAPLRNYLRKELDRFAGHWKGEASFHQSFPIDYASAEKEYQSEVRFPGLSADEYFENEWVRNLFTVAVEELHASLAAEGKSDHFALFLQSDLQDKTGADRAILDEIAKRLGIPINDAMNTLASTRLKFHHIMIDIVRSLTTTDAEFQQEMRKIFKGS